MLIPHKRVNHQGFSYNKKLYFVGGNSYNLDEYGPKSNHFTRLKILGEQLKPRSDFAISVLGDRVFIHCGWTGLKVSLKRQYHSTDY